MTLPRGRIPKPFTIGKVVELKKEDLAILREPRVVVGRIQKFRDSHHNLARLLAAGLRPAQAGALAGYSTSRVALLNADPAFQELIAEKRKLVDETYAESIDAYYELASLNMVKAERMLSDKLDKAEEEDETLPTRDLIAISRDAADRFGYGKHTTQTNLNVDFASKLEGMRRRSGRTVDGNVNQAPGSQQPTPFLQGTPVQRRRIA